MLWRRWGSRTTGFKAKSGPEEWPDPRVAVWWDTLAALLLGLFLFCAFGGFIFGPVIDHVQGWRQLRKFMEECPPDEIRVKEFLHDGDSFNFQIDLVADKMNVDFLRGHDGEWSWFWCRCPTGVFHTITAPSVRSPTIPLAGSAEFKRLLNGFAAPQTPLRESYQQEVHLAFWKDSQLCIYHYSAKLGTGDLQKLSDAMGLIRPEFGPFRWRLDKWSYY